MANTQECVLTTTDNPFDPFTEPDEWYQYDATCGHGASALVARLAATSWSLSDEENDAIIDEAMDRIIEDDPTGLYKKVYKEANKSID